MTASMNVCLGLSTAGAPVAGCTANPKAALTQPKDRRPFLLQPQPSQLFATTLTGTKKGGLGCLYELMTACANDCVCITKTEKSRKRGPKG